MLIVIDFEVDDVDVERAEGIDVSLVAQLGR